MIVEQHSNIPGQIEAALSFLRHAEEISNPTNFSGGPTSGRNLSRTEYEVKDSALIVLLQYFNQPIPTVEYAPIKNQATQD
jgi:hypothetical protein